MAPALPPRCSRTYGVSLGNNRHRGLAPTRLNLSNNWFFALSLGASTEEVPHGAQTATTPTPSGFSASLADPCASGGRRGTTPDRLAESVVAGPAPARTARSPAAAAAYPHAPAAPDAARDGGDHREPGVAAAARSGGGAEGLGPRRDAVGHAAAGESASHHQAPRRVACGGDG